MKEEKIEVETDHDVQGAKKLCSKGTYHEQREKKRTLKT